MEMLRRAPFSVGEYYHVYSRGVNKGDIFKAHSDYVRFLLLLYVTNNMERVHLSNIFRQGPSLTEVVERLDGKETLVDIGAYCLMPNHFHLLLREKREAGIPTFMKKLMTGYSMFFNKKYQRTGPLFEGRYKAQFVDRDEHLKYLFSYIHLNPVKLFQPDWKENGIRDMERAKDYLYKYTYSSYPDYLDVVRAESNILEKSAFPGYFLEPQSFERYVTEWLAYKDVKDGP